MRLFALLTLSLIALAPLHPADATTTRQQQAASRPAATAPSAQARTAARPPARSVTRAAPPRSARSQATTGRTQATASTRRRPAATSTTNRNRTATAACQRRDGRGRCVGARSASVQAPLSWQGGLPAASNSQSSCPNGTMATLARGHSDVTRCMPI